MSQTSRVTPISLSSSRRAARGMQQLSDTDILRDYARRDKQLKASDRRITGLRKLASTADFALDDHDDAYASWRERDRKRTEHNPVFLDEELTSQQMNDRLRYKKSLTNANWIPSLTARQREETSSHPLDQFVAARGHNVIGRGGLLLSEAVHEYGLFSPLDYYTQARIKVGKEKNGARWSTWLGNIVTNNENLASIQANPDDSYRFLVVDIDRSDALDCALFNKHMPAPSYFVHSTENGHGHAVYAIRNPVYHGSNTKSFKPLRYWRHVSEKVRRAVNGDINYTGYFTKNPYCPNFITYWGKSSNMYALHELDECATRALDARIEHETMKLDDSHEDTTAKKIVRNSRALEEQTVGRNNTIFDAVRKYAYKHRREASSLTVWSETIMQRCVEVSEEIHTQGEFSDRERLNNKELACIAKSIANWTWERESLNGGQYSAEQRSRSARARAARSFSELVSRIKRVLSNRGRTGFRRIRFDRSARTITLPRGVTVREIKRLWRAEFEQNMRSDWLLVLTEDIGDVDMLVDDRERLRRLYGLRSLAQLSLAEQCEILEHAMTSPCSYAQIERDFVLDSGVVKRLTMKYKRTPWLLAGEGAPDDEETRELLIVEATSRWSNAVRNGGTIDKLFESTADIFDSDVAVADDEVTLEATITDRFNAWLFVRGDRDAWRPTKLWRFIVLFSQNLITVRSISSGEMRLSVPDFVHDSLVEDRSNPSDETEVFERFERVLHSIEDITERRALIRQMAGQVVRDEFGEHAESVPQTLVKLCENGNLEW